MIILLLKYILFIYEYHIHIHILYYFWGTFQACFEHVSFEYIGFCVFNFILLLKLPACVYQNNLQL